MTTETTPESTSAPQTVNIQIGLGAQYVQDFSFESPNAPMIFAEMANQPKMALDVNVSSRSIGSGTHEDVLKIKLEAKSGEKTAFIVELAYAGLFTLPPELPEDQAKLFLMVEAPRLLFPYARAIISNALRDGGFPAVTLQPIDFMSLYASQQQQFAAQPTMGAA